MGFGKKFSQLQARIGSSLQGDEVVCIEAAEGVLYNAATISAIATDNSINDTANGLPIIPVGAAVHIAGFVDTQTELNGEHFVVSSTPSKLIVETNITSNEAAGASVTVQEKNKSYKLSITELLSLMTSGVTQTAAISGATDLDFTAHDNFVLTLTGNVTLTNPSTYQVGAEGTMIFIQDGSGNRSVGLGTSFETVSSGGLTLSSAAGATDLVPYRIIAADRILLGAPLVSFG